MAHKLFYTDDAIDDLDVIFDYIARDNRSAALQLVSRIEQNIKKLQEFPKLGTVLQDCPVLEQTHRKLTVAEPYIVFYIIRPDTIEIRRILSAQQDWLHLLITTPTGDA